MTDKIDHESFQAHCVALSILESWGVEEQIARRIIGAPSLDIQDTEIRVNIILEIHDCLGRIFENPKNITGFMTMKNENGYFMGNSPLEKIRDGKIESLQTCASYLKALSIGS